MKDVKLFTYYRQANTSKNNEQHASNRHREQILTKAPFLKMFMLPLRL